MTRRVLYLRCTSEEHAALARASGRANLPISTWVRSVLRSQLGVVGEDPFKRNRNRYSNSQSATVVYVRCDAELYDAVVRAAATANTHVAWYARDVALAHVQV